MRLIATNLATAARRHLSAAAKPPNTEAAAAAAAVAVPGQERKLVEADIISGVPPEVTRRGARIYRPAKTAMQSGKAETQHWKIDFDIQGRWENPLMGWSSSADPVQALRIKFQTKEDAIAFAERQGYDFWVEEPHESRFQTKIYANNFKYVPGKLRIMHTK